MTPGELLKYLAERGIEVWAEGDRLRYNAPKDTLTPDLRASLVERKAEILAFLHAREQEAELRPASRSRELPLSPAQQRLWFLAQLEPGNPFYNIPNAIRLRGALHLAIFQQCLNAIVQRHEPLRTTFINVDGQPVQVISPAQAQPLPVIDLRALSDAEQEIEIQRLTRQDFLLPFDLTQDSPLRTSLLRLRDNEHVLLLNMHHIASDGWSMGILDRELSTLYQAFLRGEPSPLPPLPIQYADYAVWQQKRLQGNFLETQAAYWREQLAGAPPSLELPTDRPRPSTPGFRGDTFRFDLPPALYQELTMLSRQAGATLFMTLLAAFQILLARYSGQRDIVVSTPVAGRNRSELEGLIGFFVNALVIRTNLAGNPSCHELLQRVRQTVLGAFMHQDLPFEQVVEIVKPERDISRMPFDRIAFVLQNAPQGSLNLPGLQWRPLRIADNSAKSDLTLFILEDAAGPKGILEYSTDLFAADTIRRLANHYLVLLAEICREPAQRIEHLTFLSRSERSQFLQERHTTTEDLPRALCLHEYFEAQAARTPHATALSFQEKHLTYQALNCMANRIAHFLRSKGAGPEVCVGLYMERSLEQIIALLAILKAGAVYLPLDPHYPPERLSFILSHSRPGLLLTQSSLRHSLPTEGITCPVLSLDSVWDDRVASQPMTSPVVNIHPANLAYVIYTSGSTGQPKGVMVEHQSVCSIVDASMRTCGIEQGERILQCISLSFDASIMEIFLALLSGSTLCLVPSDTLSAGKDFAFFLQRQAITVLCGTPSHLEILPTQDFPVLQKLFIGGETCSLQTRVRWAAGRHFFIVYGPTEASIQVTVQEWTESYQSSAPIGRPLTNVQIYVLDAYQQPVPLGVAGDLYIGGVCLTRGYLDCPDQTAERFIPDPFSGRPGARLYDTGDRARWLSDGSLEFLGRRDRQIKLRGFRIELEEIEATLARHPLVREQVVTLRETADGEQHLVAYLILNQEQIRHTSSFTEQVAQWQTLYDNIYSQLSLQRNPLFNFEGWDSTYTGQPLPQEEMREWADHTVERILRLKPQRVLEIGCGAGLLLWRLAPYCEFYHGTDLSIQALHYLQTILHRPAYTYSHVQLEQREATDFAGIEEQGYDLVLLNSVAQYFPGIDYLLRVLEGVIHAVRPGGHIFIGDIRNLHLLKTFHASVQLYQAQPALLLSELQQRIRQLMAQDPELVLDPTFFIALKQRFPRISYVQIEPKRGYPRNELTCFRYDVTLTLDSAPKALRPPSWLDWESQIGDMANVRNRLMANPEILGITTIPNARLQFENQALDALAHNTSAQSVSDLKEALSSPGGRGIEIEDLYVLAANFGYTVETSWLSCSEDGSFDAVFTRTQQGNTRRVAFPERAGTLPLWNAYANNPLQGRLADHVVPQVQQFLKASLPAHMIPAAFLLMEGLPRLPGGKIDYRALPEPESGRPALSTAYVSPRSEVERAIAAIWQEVLHIEKIGTHDNFFDLGGHSLLLVQVHSRLNTALKRPLSILDLFTYPTISGLAAHLSQGQGNPTMAAQGQQRAEARQQVLQERDASEHTSNEIAIIGLAGRFPGARDVEQFWQNIKNSIESIEFFTPEEMIAFGVPPEVARDPAYVPAFSRLADVDVFDADFFGYSPREAEMMDPQQRIFLECAWEALENAGYNPDTYKRAIGVYAGSSTNTYFLFNVLPQQELIARVGFYQAGLGNDAAFLTTRASYKLNLRGPSVSVSTACSTSLVAIHMACQSLLHGECDMALAGGVTIGVPQEAGYTYVEGMIASPDGHCRTFDAQAKGTIGGNGIGLVVLKPLATALRDGDSISAVIKGSAINNDGSDKVGFTAPSVKGQAAVITEALMVAGAGPETIGYVEAHGTGTVLGDPIEIAALTRAYRQHTAARGYCAIGSVKSNIGHLDNAAGVAGLIKTVMALKEKMLPPTLHFERPNPKIDFADSPFYVNTALTAWESDGMSRRAGVSAFGIGGTNAHAILEEAPAVTASSASRRWQLLVLSARTPSALEKATKNLTTYLERHPGANLADVAYTYQAGRKAFEQRRILVCCDKADALSALHDGSTPRLLSMRCNGTCSPVFLFPGQGTQYVGMGRELYEVEPTFRSQIDLCSEILINYLDQDVRALLYPAEEQTEQASQQLNETEFTQAALFVTEYALARLWMSWGVLPEAMLGHSVGEYVAACLAGVFSLEDALRLVAMRGRLMQQLPHGRMLSVPLSAAEFAPLLGEELALAAVNGPASCVASGPGPAIERLRDQLAEQRIESQILHTSHAFHSTMMEPLLSEFQAQVARVQLHPPRVPYLSNVSGTWITPAEATSPVYWARHLRQTVRFADGVQELLQEPGNVFLEIGPGYTLGSLIRQQGERAAGRIILSSPGGPRDRTGNSELLLTMLGKLWLAGANIDWSGFSAHERRLRVALPTYPFERQRYWLEAPGRTGFSAYREMTNGRPERVREELSDESPSERHTLAESEFGNEIERTLFAIWSELLGTEQISRYDNFFELGGHSLMATQIIARLRGIFPVTIPVESIFTAPTIWQLAETLEELLLQQIETLSEEEVDRLKQS